MSRYQKGKTNLDFSEARDSEWQLHQLGHRAYSSEVENRKIELGAHYAPEKARGIKERRQTKKRPTCVIMRAAALWLNEEAAAAGGW